MNTSEEDIRRVIDQAMRCGAELVIWQVLSLIQARRAQIGNKAADELAAAVRQIRV